jgi:hypothetical protein
VLTGWLSERFRSDSGALTARLGPVAGEESVPAVQIYGWR